MNFINFVLFLCTIFNYVSLGENHTHVSRSHFNHLFDSDNRIDFTPVPSEQNVEEICLSPDECVIPIQCPAHVYANNPKHCRLEEGREGVCCSSNSKQDSPSGKSSSNLVVISAEKLNEAIATSRAKISELLLKETRLLTSERSAVLSEGSPSFEYFRNFRISHPLDLTQVSNLAQNAFEIALVTQHLKEKEGFTNEQLAFENVVSNLHVSPLAKSCIIPPTCAVETIKYRTYDGSCNHRLEHSSGVAMTPFSRLLPPSYSDGIWTPRVSMINGKPLSSPRLITATVFSDVDRPDVQHTLMLMQFGQFLAHDITRALNNRHLNGSGISCCRVNGGEELPPELRHHACMPISVASNDPFYKHFGQNCMHFVRSVLAPRQDCNLGYSQQMNRVSHFIDGSVIYGTDRATMLDLREFSGGRLRMFHDFGRELLPLSKNAEDCITMEQGSACFLTGDNRCNQIISLVVLHTIFAREHNRLASTLSALNPHWSDERLFQEARRILIAELQHIVYTQWLPEVIGHRAIKDFGLNVQHSGYSINFDERIDPSILNEFATAALRFGHSIVDGKMKMYGRTKIDEILDIPEVMFYPSRMRRRHFLDEMLNTLTVESSQMVDTSISDALKNYMFRAGNPFGVDLVSINIQRGRDHGLRPYNDYRELIGLPRCSHFDDFGHEPSGALRQVYESPDDVDLYVGGLMETKVPDSMVGPTFRDIIADQFVRLRKGDRYFYDLHPNINPGAFTPDQLNEIKETTMARIVCDNSDGILLARQALNPFRKPGLPGNELIDCSTSGIPRLNLIHWQEKS